MQTVADVIGLMGVVIGFTLALGWDIWQDYRHVKVELYRAARSIEQELSTDLALLSTDLGANDQAPRRVLNDLHPEPADRESRSLPTHKWREDQLSRA